MHICSSLLPARTGCEHKAAELPCSSVGRPCPAPRSSLLCVRAFLFLSVHSWQLLQGHHVLPSLQGLRCSRLQLGCSSSCAAQPSATLPGRMAGTLPTDKRPGTQNGDLGSGCSFGSQLSQASLLKLQGCTGSLISTAAQMVRF